MAKSTNKAKSFFEQRKKATPTKNVVEIAAKGVSSLLTDVDIIPKQDPVPPVPVLPIQTNTIPEQIIQKQASGKKEEKVLPAEMPEDLKKFIETNNFTTSAKVSANIPVEFDNKLQIALLGFKRKYGLNNRQMNKTILLSYIIEKTLREDELFA
jgi:hypothetical protein